MSVTAENNQEVHQTTAAEVLKDGWRTPDTVGGSESISHTVMAL